ncbi:MAG TPA: hypothetical protein VKX49_28875 [Bryobacteraceae bacterium]|nr:hypothetical protein [Bryobacteraceae bacterium]
MHTIRAIEGIDRLRIQARHPSQVMGHHLDQGTPHPVQIRAGIQILKWDKREPLWRAARPAGTAVEAND